MTRLPRTVPITLALAAVAAPAPAAHASTRAKALWATINICDTKHHPNKLGIRARMPGNGTHQRMYMRFVAEYRTDGRWRELGRGGVSPWSFAGSAVYVNREFGFTFRIDRPPKGTSYLMRGLVKFQWRAYRRHHWRVVRRAQRVTEAGHHASGADPKGYSAAACRIR